MSSSVCVARDGSGSVPVTASATRLVYRSLAVYHCIQRNLLDKGLMGLPSYERESIMALNLITFGSF